MTTIVTATSSSKARLAYLDNLKAYLIILVVIHHTAVAYSGFGIWYYNETQPMGVASTYFFRILLSFDQAYFMSLFFMIAAYFIPTSLDRKGALRYIKDRFVRLGLPTLIFALIINPVVVMIAHQNASLAGYVKYITSLSFVSGTGPMWFALVLLIFSLLYVPFNKAFIRLTNKYAFAISTKNVLVLIALVTIVAFVLRLYFPIGTAVLNLQFCFFSAYIFMFLFGIIAYRKNLFESLQYKTALKWLIAAIVIGMPAFVIGFQLFLKMPAHNATFVFSLWESFFCVTFIIGLMGVFKRYFNKQNRLQKILSANAFSVYVFHPLILVSVSVLLKGLHIGPFPKFVLVACLAVPLSFILAALVRAIRPLNKIFS